MCIFNECSRKLAPKFISRKKLKGVCDLVGLTPLAAVYKSVLALTTEMALRSIICIVTMSLEARRLVIASLALCQQHGKSQITGSNMLVKRTGVFKLCSMCNLSSLYIVHSLLAFVIKLSNCL